MQQYIDWSTFIKLDNASTLDFVTSLVAALSEHQQITQADIDSLRLLLNSRPAQWSNDGKSIVSGLQEDRADILAVFAARFGVTGFALNHTRFTLRGMTSDLIGKLAVWADFCLKKSELVFNRPFFVAGASRVERRELFSQVLVVMARELHDTIAELRSVVNALSTMRPSGILDTTGEIEQTDTKIALQVGFAGLDEFGSFSRVERKALQKISMLMTNLSESMTEVVRQLIPNCVPSEKLVATTGQCELLAAEAQSFAGLTLPESESLVVWETRRLTVCFGMHTMIQIVDAVASSTLDALVPREVRELDSYLSRDVEKTLTVHMSKQGAPIHEAEKAAQAIIAYCLRHQTAPSQLIEPELKKIHPALTPSTLTQFITLTSGDLAATPGGAVSKQRVSQASKTIRKGLSTFAPFAAPLAAVVFGILLQGCGWKTGIHSDTVEPRPEIPYRGNPSTALNEPHAAKPPVGASNTKPSTPISSSKEKQP